MDAMKFWITNGLIPARDLLAGYSLRSARHAVAAAMHVTPEEQLALQENLLRLLLEECFESVEAYRPYRSLRHHARTQPMSVLREIPPLARPNFRKNPDAYRHQHVTPRQLATPASQLTAGYSYLRTKTAWSYDEAASDSMLSRLGIDMMAAHVELRGHLPSTFFAKEWAWRGKQAFSKNVLYPLGAAIQPAKLSALVETLKKPELAYCIGSPSVLSAIATMIEAAHTPFRTTCKAVLCSGETLTPAEKQQIASVFGVPVYNVYSTSDDGMLACDCPQGGLHICEDNVIIDIVDGSGKLLPMGQEGQVAVTNLHNYAMPRLRFLTGDKAALVDAPCECGRTGKRLVGLTGTKHTLYTAPDGRLVPSRVVALAAAGYPSINCCQLEQQDPQRATLVIELKTRSATDQCTALHRQICQLLPGVLIDLNCSVTNHSLKV